MMSEFFSLLHYSHVLQIKSAIMTNTGKACLIMGAFVLLLGSCTSRQERTAVQLEVLLDSLQAEYAPDSRIELWTLQAQRGEQLVLDGSLAREDAYVAIETELARRFPEVVNQVELLPQNDRERTVNGLINNSVGHMRSEPRHMADIVTQTLLGTPVRILKEENDWYLIQTPNKYLGWIDGAAVEPLNREELNQFRESKKIIYTQQYGFSYSEPDQSSLPVSDLVVGCLLAVEAEGRMYYQVRYPDGRLAFVKRNECLPAEVVFQRVPDQGSVVEDALKYNGIPYLWGGTSSKAIDCSGFSSMVYYMNGTILMRDADQQSRAGMLVTEEYEYAGLEPGDLLFFGRRATEEQKERVTHVAVYIGDSEFIHASGKVRINSMDPDRENFLSEYPDIFLRTVRIIGQEDEGIIPVTRNPFYVEILSSPE
jgi:hypothetical protein